MQLKSKEDLDKLRMSGDILAHILNHLRNIASAGKSLKDLDYEAQKIINKKGAKSAFFQFQPGGASKPFPAHICTSVNEQVVHGVPDDYILQEGDILSIDLGISYEGYITDSAISFPIGDVPKQEMDLLKTTKKALTEAISLCRPGVKTGDIGAKIQGLVEGNGFKIIKSLTGHGIGLELHEEPTIYNFGTKGTGQVLEEGIVVAIEPITSISAESITKEDDDSFITKDRSKSAHFEATVVVSQKEPNILTPVLDIVKF